VEVSPWHSEEERVISIVKMSRNVDLFTQQAAKRKTRRARDNATAHLASRTSSGGRDPLLVHLYLLIASEQTHLQSSSSPIHT
jgi:hypothetical protein